ncbi:putative Trichohyalin [Neospora caninum Liverpool]|uniref:Putative Trichohyalin n=1 Tax=Neospora caninum (strain Liverpool) TaxID=572307 RepID=F0VG05_NEOCL|nr:putative Trichohyalin [Neospora caninum Liverpool]CBZ52649.1 putative Trichohyalin [Neospora caninum Liverpool]CEL66626.1 TPA: Trichohyalin, putative [Neospora caninum Liverpool]|eukprot:XP_003882681.1 putative Trichohyalin [Neospora caninum Liverpool]
MSQTAATNSATVAPRTSEKSSPADPIASSNSQSYVQSMDDFVVLDEHERACGYVVKFQSLCSQSELSVSIHERVSARLETKRKRLSRQSSLVEREKRARERHEEHLCRRRVVARKFIERRAAVVERIRKTQEERAKNLELRVNRLDKRALDFLESSTPGLETAEEVGGDSLSLDADPVAIHQKRAEETLANRIEGIQANLQKKMQSAEERRNQLRAQEKERLAKALQQIEKVQGKNKLEEEEKSLRLQEKLEEAERRRKQLLDEESSRRKQKWEEKREVILAREMEIEEKKKSLEERVELAIERKNKIIEETKLTLQKKITEAEEQVSRNRTEMERRLQELAEKMSQKQEKAEQLRVTLMKRKKAPSPSTLRALHAETSPSSNEDRQDMATCETGTALEEEVAVN